MQENMTPEQYLAAARELWTEKQFTAKVREFAELNGWFVYHTQDSRKSVLGFPDLILIRGPKLYAVELKVRKGKLTPEQTAWLAAFAGVSGANVKSCVWRPSDWPEIEEVLR